MSFIARAMYKRGSFPGQIDHVGWLSRVVRDEAAYLQALADGWGPTMTDPAPDPASAPETPDPLPKGWRRTKRER